MSHLFALILAIASCIPQGVKPLDTAGRTISVDVILMTWERKPISGMAFVLTSTSDKALGETDDKGTVRLQVEVQPDETKVLIAFANNANTQWDTNEEADHRTTLLTRFLADH